MNKKNKEKIKTCQKIYDDTALATSRTVKSFTNCVKWPPEPVGNKEFF